MDRYSQKPRKPQSAKTTPNLLYVVLSHQQAGRFAEADTGYQQLLNAAPDDADAWHLWGVLAAEQQQYQTATERIQRALKLKPHEPVFLGNLGNVFLQQEKFGQAIDCYQQALQGHPEEVIIRKRLAMICEQQLDSGIEHQRAGRLSEAETCYRDVLQGQPERADAWHLLGVIASKRKQYGVAVEYVERAIALAPDVANYCNSLGCIHQDQQHFEEAITYYQKALQLQSNQVSAHFNLGQAYEAQKQFTAAEAAYRKALELRPNYPEAYHSLGNLLETISRSKEAEVVYRKALEFNPGYSNALFSLGELLHKNNKICESLNCFEQILTLDKNYQYIPGLIMKCRTKLCMWENHNVVRQELLESIRQGRRRRVTPFVFLNCSEDPLDQHHCAEIWAQDHYSEQPQVAWASPRYLHDKLRLAYVSPDFGEHPVAYLMTALIEKHDRARFEVFGISIGPERRGPWRERLIKGFDHFLDIRNVSDQAAVQQLRELEIDIAIDLAGYTANNRASIFASRIAPIQANYLGFPGTMGAEFMDYLLADRFVIPQANEHCYAEKIICLPDTFQCSPPRSSAEQTPTRQELGLPETGFVFCCFNNTYKIHPEQFDIWMRLLTQVENSVLWLFKANEEAKNNLCREAKVRGVNPDRLIFAPRAPLPQYLARYRQADLFLDTLPYNAGTTASDALWAGLPVLTCAGRSFVSRMGGSLLRAIGLPELVTENLVDYETLALRLANHPEELAAVKQKLEHNRHTEPLFDVDYFRRHIEAAYQQMWEIRQQGKMPTAFSVKSIKKNERKGV